MSLSAVFKRTILAIGLVAVMAGAASAKDDGPVIATVAVFQVNEGMSAEFEDVMRGLMAAVHAAEPGTLLYALHREGETNTYYMLERYANQAAQDAHATTDEVRAFFPRLGPLLAEPLELIRLTEIE